METKYTHVAILYVNKPRTKVATSLFIEMSKKRAKELATLFKEVEEENDHINLLIVDIEDYVNMEEKLSHLEFMDYFSFLDNIRLDQFEKEHYDHERALKYVE